MSDKLFNPVFSRLQQTLDLRLKQHGLVSSNIANANTPGYLAKRVNFQKAFAQMMGDGSDGAAVLRGSSAQHMGSDASSAAPIETLKAQAWSQDGNSVKAEEEMVVLAENNLLYNATVEVLKRRLGMLEYAASDGGK
ncbi:MAG: flagellar basal body rod protein FlgB [Rickettsiales bacterium]|nr:flagellar basal body rod protein FlgB [Rickettsiales bacterium]|tara:strand:- start:1451 stop:1861 length:411 start_codon:yes stop_codon:yes gene_type:complete